ncbi:MAG: hypothetical protein BWY23_01415 [Spirochaetes bacterium ADurb.Bin218]|nr:MAG: hypothetical protein BWY23_01415 [Spirochaetes bacterium ADurb.Bin218]
MEPENRFQPIIAPTTDWDVETGRLNLVMNKIARAVDNVTMKAPAISLTDPSLPRVKAAPVPEITDPRIRKILVTIAAVRNLTICVPMAVPKTLPALLAPWDHPRNNPLERKKRIDILHDPLHCSY